MLKKEEYSMPQFDIAAASAAIRVQEDFIRLSLLDDLWTSYLRDPAPVSSYQIKALDQIVTEMHELLGRVREHAIRLESFIQDHRYEFDKTFQGLISTPISLISFRQPGFVDDLIKAIVRPDVGFARFALSQLAILKEESSREAELLTTKMQRIRDTGVSEGDLSRRVKCALLVAVVGAAVYTVIVNGPILFPAVAHAIQTGPAAAWIAFHEHHGISFSVEVLGAVSHFVSEIGECVECFKDWWQQPPR